jgi:hypothetical protein
VTRHPLTYLAYEQVDESGLPDAVVAHDGDPVAIFEGVAEVVQDNFVGVLRLRVSFFLF